MNIFSTQVKHEPYSTADFIGQLDAVTYQEQLRFHGFSSELRKKYDGLNCDKQYAIYQDMLPMLYG